MSKRSIVLCLILFLVCIGIAGCEEKKPIHRAVSERVIAQIDPSSGVPRSLTVSPNNRRIAYVAGLGDKGFVVVGGESRRPYDDIDGPIFSPDSKRVAYVAGVGNRWVVVVDGEEGRE